MSSPYNRAFTKCIRKRWYALPQHTQNTVGFDGRQGDLGSADEDSLALYDTFNYQRSHADAFRRALRRVDLRTPPEDQITAVIDIGAGAGTVAVALSELWKDNLAQVSYFAIEPHRYMRTLGRELLAEMDTPFSQVKFKKNLRRLQKWLSELRPSWILVTSSYVVHQSSVTVDDINEWVRAIDLTRRTHGAEKVEILATTVNSNKQELVQRNSMPFLKDCLEALRPGMQRTPFWFSSNHRFPKPGSSQTGWKPAAVDYNNVHCVSWRDTVGESQ